MGFKKTISGTLALLLAVLLFAQIFYWSMLTLREGIEKVEAAGVESSAVLPVEEAAEGVGRVYVGWDNRTMEPWEFELFVRVFYLEFYGSSDVLCEAGCDAILRLWESEEFGPTIGGLLTAVNAAGKYVYDVYAYVWDWQYDEEGLEWCRSLCMKRFTDGPTWQATYFQKWGYPDWGPWSPIPCYEIDGIYFSISRWNLR